MRKSKGFTLVELIIVIAIIAALFFIAFPVYKNFANRALDSEGESLLVKIDNAQKKYHAKFGVYYDGGEEAKDYDETLGIDARENKNFKTFTITSTGKSYSAQAIGSGRAKDRVLKNSYDRSDK
ncbi:type IV pilin protein [Endomicrobium proavitum]|uniref:Putative type IV pilin n=1 Tax=Endomicrobium proavitum TaxID=1408281 RepID=A0A0G3WGD4_9BACT|nr:prepilin-type N-terminal cleavage/methylation domain-containing protein [Endomicrobium proavitum]AKL97423.1 putative type IV pilin [Endomicrobium proavitum]